MFARTIRDLLSMHPQGLSTDQMLWTLRRAALRHTAEDVLGSLTALVETGEIVAKAGRWRTITFDVRAGEPKQKGSRGQRPSAGPDQASLIAIPATTQPRSSQKASELPEVVGGTAADADWRALLRYYAATQRQDPRGRVDERADQHSTSWQLFQTIGTWWQDADLYLPLDTLPATFRVALARRPDCVCSLGYPVAFHPQPDVPSYLPAMLLPATYRLTETHLVVEPMAAAPAINPAWIEVAASRSTWQKEALSAALLPEGESAELEMMVSRLKNALATKGGQLLRPATLDVELAPGAEGLRNAAALFLPSDATFTGGAARDLEAMTGWTDAQMQGTALAVLLGPGANAMSDGLPPASPTPLTDRQQAAATAGLSGPLTVIQGPPGTGKSTVILSMLSSIVLSGGSVLLASRNHQALDEIEGRLKDLVGEAPILTRGRDGSGERDTSIMREMRLLAAGETRLDDSDTAGPAVAIEQARGLQADVAAAAERETANVALSVALERLEQLPQPSPVAHGRTRRWRRFWQRLTQRKPSSAQTAEALARTVQVYRRTLASLPPAPAPRARDDLAEAVSAAVREAFRRHAGALTTPTRSEASLLENRVKELDFNRRTRQPLPTADDCRRVLLRRPAWAVSSLSVPSRIPLAPGVFDYVVFDEASQCDIASALPLLGRARRAIIVGDPMQLGFIPQVSLRQEHALMDAAGVGPAGRHLIAQGVNSLFDLAQRRPAARRHFLADQFRSDPAIVGYLNDEFYDGRLVSAQDPGRVRLPQGYKPGLAWLDVPGTASREDGGTVNHDEAAAVVATLAEMIRDRDFSGSVGVLSPFNAQVALLLRSIQAALTEAEREKISLRVSTIDRFQGGEADVILFSLVVAPGMAPATLGFYTRERRRVNVAISRARALCLVVGNKSFVVQSDSPLLKRLLDRTERVPKPREGFDSEWERRLDAAMRRRGLDPIPQYPVAGRYLDFALDPEGRRLDVEVDGRFWHAGPDGNRKPSDRLRDRALIAQGWKVRRFWVHELADDMEACIDSIERDLGRG